MTSWYSLVISANSLYLPRPWFYVQIRTFTYVAFTSVLTERSGQNRDAVAAHTGGQTQCHLGEGGDEQKPWGGSWDISAIEDSAEGQGSSNRCRILSLLGLRGSDACLVCADGLASSDRQERRSRAYISCLDFIM